MAEQEPVHHYKIRIRRPRLTPEAQNSTDTMAQQGRGEVHSDVLGSYTGTAEDDPVPEQDADDLWQKAPNTADSGIRGLFYCSVFQSICSRVKDALWKSPIHGRAMPACISSSP